MAQNFENMSELDRMKADAIKRARQMHLRAVNLPPNSRDQKDSEHNATAKPSRKVQAFQEMAYLK